MPELKQFQASFFARVNGAAMPATPMMVYSNTALSGAVDALAANYPVTREIVGKRTFDALALAFVRKYPPNSPILANYGGGFPDWLEDQQAGKRLAYLPDVARCDRMWLEAMHAADARVVEFDELRRRPSAELVELRLKLHPAVRVGWQATPAIDIWLAHQQPGMGEIAPEWRARGALFTRPELSVQGRVLDAASHRLLHGLRLGETLGAAAAASSSLYPASDIGACFAGLVASGSFCAAH